MSSTDTTAPVPPARARQRAAAVLASVAVALVATGLAFLRMSGTSRGTMWAEDAAVFSRRATDRALQTSWIFTPYDGYTHSIPQLTANVLWSVVPIEKMAVAFSLAACLIAGAVAAGVFALTARWGLNLPGRLLLAATTVLVPGLRSEVLGNLANAHWFLLWLAPFLFLWVPRRWWSSAAAALIAFFIATTEIQSLVFTPLLLWRIRDRKRWPMIAAMAAGAAVQLWAFAQETRERATGAASVISTISGYLLQVPLSALTGSGRITAAIVGHAGWITACLAIVPFVLCAIWVARGSRRRALAVTAVMALSLALWSAGYVINFAPALDFAAMDRQTLNAGVSMLRYAAVPMMLLFGIVAVAVGRGSPGGSAEGSAGGSAWRLRLPAASVLVTTLCLFAAGYPDSSPRESGPLWAASLEAAQEECAAPGADDQTTIAVAPENWGLDIACALVEP
ncbi:MAG: hypothetical protein QM677_01355 [Microbacterium sp.]